MQNRHSATDLKQMQSLPLEAKIRMSEQRIKVWYESWVRFEIYNKKTKKTRFATIDRRDIFAEPPLKENEYIVSVFDGQAYVSFSGGKDSTVLADLCARVCKKYGWTLYLLFVNTGLEYPEIQKFVKTYAEWLRKEYKIEVVLDILRPEMRFDEVIKKHGYPVASKEVAGYVREAKHSKSEKLRTMRIQRLRGEYRRPDGKLSEYNCPKWGFLLDAPFEVSDKCCAVMKKKPLDKFAKETGRKGIIGTMAHESRFRRQSWIRYGCNMFDSPSKQLSRPLSFWTERDILQYIKEYNIPYCSVYGDVVSDGDRLKTTGCDRTGCIFCMFGCHLEKEPNRFQRLKETHPRQYEYCINGGEYIVEGFAQTSSGEWAHFAFEDDDGNKFTPEEIENFIEENKDNPFYKFVRKWQPNKEGLGLGKVLDYIGVKYE